MSGQWRLATPSPESIGGGGYDETGTDYPASVRLNNLPGNANINIGFRPTLIL